MWCGVPKPLWQTTHWRSPSACVRPGTAVSLAVAARAAACSSDTHSFHSDSFQSGPGLSPAWAPCWAPCWALGSALAPSWLPLTAAAAGSAPAALRNWPGGALLRGCTPPLAPPLDGQLGARLGVPLGSLLTYASRGSMTQRTSAPIVPLSPYASPSGSASAGASLGACMAPSWARHPGSRRAWVTQSAHASRVVRRPLPEP